MEWTTLRKSEKPPGKVADGQEKRKIIGERAVEAIRFPVMKLEEFASVVIDSKILTYDEVADVVKCFDSVQRSSVVFPVIKRSCPASKLRRCHRFDKVQFGWRNCSSSILFFCRQ